MTQPMRLASIRIYPVKALRGVAVDTAVVEPWGLAGDRRWIVVDSAGRLISQREASGLALIEARPEGEDIRLSALGRPSLLVQRPAPRPSVEVSLWRERVPAAWAGPDADDWLSTTRGSICRLAYMAEPERARPVNPAFGLEQDRVSFADSFPLLLTNVASLADLAGRAGQPDLSMDRFRTNLVIDGAAAWAEDAWRELTIGEVRFAVANGCERCVVTTIDQASGERHPRNEPLRTLMSFRRNARGRPIFGVDLIPRSGGMLSVGDRLTIA